MLPIGILDQGVAFTTRWTVGAGVSITLPLVQNRAEGALSYNFRVDWGDGTASTVTAYNDANRVHTYSSAGTYTVRIYGTMEGWSFGGLGDTAKIVAVVHWGCAPAFKGFKYLAGGFLGCHNLTSLGVGPIPASGTGVLSDGFKQTFYFCNNNSLTTIPAGLFDKHPNVTTHAFDQTFAADTAINSIPAGLFNVHTQASTYAFFMVFSECSFSSIPTDLFRYNTLVSTHGFDSAFQYNNNITSIPVDLFRYNTLVSSGGFQKVFKNCDHLAALPTDLFRYNTLVSANGFANAFDSCPRLASVPADLFRYNTACTDFSNVFYGCTKLKSLSTIFYEPGEETTRFLNLTVDFSNAFYRASFNGSQGTAPNLWTCDFGETITLSTAPAVDWDPGDTITGQTSAATVIVVSKVSALVYKIKQHLGTFTLGEIVGVTGVPTKLAAQDGSHPTFSGTPTSAGCFGGAGNSLTSLDNYASIPSQWE